MVDNRGGEWLQHFFTFLLLAFSVLLPLKCATDLVVEEIQWLTKFKFPDFSVQ